MRNKVLIQFLIIILVSLSVGVFVYLFFFKVKEKNKKMGKPENGKTAETPKEVTSSPDAIVELDVVPFEQQEFIPPASIAAEEFVPPMSIAKKPVFYTGLSFED